VGKDNIGQILFRYRLEHKLTQAELADILGVSQNQVSTWETGEHEPRALRKKDILQRLESYGRH